MISELNVFEIIAIMETVLDVLFVLFLISSVGFIIVDVIVDRRKRNLERNRDD